MAARELPPQKLLRKLLRYEPETGKLFWRERDVEICASSSYATRWNARFSGKEAFTAKHKAGYHYGSIFGVMHLAHRVIWTMVHGDVPAEQIDHINGNGMDNRIENLRAVSNAENQRNAKRSSANTSGVTGVYWNKELGKWRSAIKHEHRFTHLGYFTSLPEACAARTAAEVKYKFHENHGRALIEQETIASQ